MKQPTLFKMDELILSCRQLLADYGFEINYPVVWDRMRGENFAEWQNIFVEEINCELHYMRFNFGKLKDEKDLVDTIFHELIHCIQHEQGLEVDHGEFFCKIVASLAKEGYNAASSECDIGELEKHGYFLKRG